MSAALAATAVAVLFLDIGTKHLASVLLEPGRPVKLLGDVVRFTLVHNAGAAFGLFPGSRLAFILFSVAAITLILVLASRLPARSPAQLLALGALLGGALGNLVDRLRAGAVVDFLDLGLGAARWPVFNVADIAVTSGVLLLLLSGLRRRG